MTIYYLLGNKFPVLGGDDVFAQSLPVSYYILTKNTLKSF